jgi:hypothetical protein
MASGGPLESITIDGRRFPIDGEVDAALALAGFTNEVKANGDKTVRVVKSAKPARINSIPIVIDDSRDDETYIQDVMDNAELVNTSIVDVNGNVWSGLCQIVEDPETSKKEGTKEINVHGTLRKQS